MAAYNKQSNFKRLQGSGRTIPNMYQTMVENYRKLRLENNTVVDQDNTPKTAARSVTHWSKRQIMTTKLNPGQYNEQLNLLKMCGERVRLPSNGDHQEQVLEEKSLPASHTTTKLQHNNQQDCLDQDENHSMPETENKVSSETLVWSNTSETEDEDRLEPIIDRFHRLTIASQTEDAVKYCKICDLHFKTTNKLAKHFTTNSHNRLLRLVLDFFNLT